MRWPPPAWWAPGFRCLLPAPRRRQYRPRVAGAQRAAVDDEVRIDITADAFCHSMVRALVGSLISVGELRVPISRPAELQAAGRRTSQIDVAPAHGLTLMAVDYPPDEELAAPAALLARGPSRRPVGSTVPVNAAGHP